MPNFQAQSESRKAAILETLENKNYSLRAAAKALGVSPGHLSRVINGERESKILLRKITTLPQHRRQIGFASPFAHIAN